jgi:ribosome-binding factor A
MPQGGRTERVGEGFREILAEEILKLKDPRVGFVTVTGVRVAPDLRHARVFFSCYGDEAAKAGTRAALRSAAPHLRAALGRQVRLKFVPELEFEEDRTFEAGQKIDSLIAKLHEPQAPGKEEG